MSTPREVLESAAQKFCSAFAEKKDIETIMSFFSTKHPISAVEYGDPVLAQFVGRPFEGNEGVKKYFGLLASTITYEGMHFSEYVVDTETRKVALKGKGHFIWSDTCESWNETFAYVLDFDEDLQLVRYQVWADSGAAYLARKGRLEEERKYHSEE
ncbi:hypothetical protein FA15DRAFT_684751 [Coprinopsis marcescibilis]|uniref:SnoaL-like domain-containing protein n=1 Tax=Coprinopsis marcescibilis TaxID=230819 RepID=A0A5C3L9A7_COPMA|nr:hypothetical protein FA15DRAFT_684751 [Coprinopsis marcescibilis]